MLVEILESGEFPVRRNATRRDQLVWLTGLSTAAQALTRASLDWEVTLRSREELREPLEIGVERFVVRSDPAYARGERLLGGAGWDYVPLQNREALGFFEPLIRKGAAQFDQAGQINGGQTIWVLARLARETTVTNSDLVGRYLMLVHHHAGPCPGVELRPVPFRLFCQNMLPHVLRTQALRLGHTEDLAERLRQLAENPALIHQDFMRAESSFRTMARQPMRSAALMHYLAEVFTTDQADTSSLPSQRVPEQRQMAAELFESGRGNSQPEARGTLWAAYNAVTELVDHHTPDASPEARVRRIWFGSGYAIKLRAYEAALRRLNAARLPERREPAAEKPGRCREVDNPEIALAGAR